jgi:hypothetical protein
MVLACGAIWMMIEFINHSVGTFRRHLMNNSHEGCSDRFDRFSLKSF